ncbi:hypothetical protein DYB30_010769 [Aphanomyces astaci]|nr:hypothetical protein DYB30_010769 [Aphanomyces astaci]
MAVHCRESIRPEGQDWMAAVQSNVNSIAGEVHFWKARNVTHYMPQWQNYKLLGVVESFTLQNVIGMSYPITLKHSNGSFQLTVATSLKTYWEFASDLWTVASNSSGVGGLSLIRQSSAYAYSTNRSINSVYLPNTSM